MGKMVYDKKDQLFSMLKDENKAKYDKIDHLQVFNKDK